MNHGASKANQHEEKWFNGTWLPMRESKGFGWEGFKVRFGDIAALKWQISWLCEMVSTAFCVLWDLSINLLFLNGCPWVIAWLFGTIWCWECTDLKICCFVLLQKNTARNLHIVRSKSCVSWLRMKHWFCLTMLKIWTCVIMVLCNCRIYEEYWRTCEWLVCAVRV